MTRPMRLLMVTPRFAPLTGGVETHVREVADRLTRRGHNVTILTTDATGELAREERVGDLRVIRVPAYPRNRDYYWAPQVYGVASSAQWDVIHCQGIHTFVPVLGMTAAIKTNTPFFVTFHSGGHSSPVRARIRRVQWLALAPLLRRAENLIAVSQYERQLFSSVLGIPRGKLVVIPNGGDLPVIGHPPEVDENLVLSLGRLERYKGHQRAIAAMPFLRQKLPNLWLRIVGSGPYRAALEQEAVRLGVADAVEIGAVDSADRMAMAELLSRAAVIVLLSDYEAHAIAAIEAIALGRPVIVTDSTGLGDLVRAGMARGVPPSASAPEIAAAIEAELASPTRREVRIPRWDEAVSRLEELYVTAVERRSPRRARQS